MTRSLGTGINTVVTGIEFGRNGFSMAVSVFTGTFGDLLQSRADMALGKPLPEVTLPLDPTEQAAPRPPDRAEGMSVGRAVAGRIVYGATGATAVTIFMLAADAGIGKILTGSILMIGSSLAQAAADYTADPFENHAMAKRKELEKHEPDHLRNASAEAIYYLANRIRSEVDSLTEEDAQTRERLVEALAHVKAMIQRTEKEVAHRLAEMRRRRNMVEPARRRLRRVAGRGTSRNHVTVTYEMVHLPSALPPALTNPGRVGAQVAAGQVPSFYLGSAESPELLTANMLAAWGRGPSLGRGWNQAVKQMIDDAATTNAARALHQLREAERAIEEILDPEQGRRPRPEPPSGRSARREQHRRDRAAGIPYEMTLATQSRKWIGAFVGSIVVASPMLLIGIPGGNVLVWIAGQAFADTMAGVAEVLGARIQLLDARIDRDVQLTEAADRLPFTMDELAESVRAWAEAGRAANEKIVPMRVPTPARRRHDARRALVRAGIGLQRGLASDLGLGPSLRPGDNDPDGVLLDRRDAVAVNRLVEVGLDLDRVVNHPIEVVEESGDRRWRHPVAQAPTMLRGYLRTELARLGLLAGQTGSAARWEAVVADVRRRFGLDLHGGDLELAALRRDLGDWADQTEAAAVRAWVDAERQSDPLGHTILDALDTMARRGWLALGPVPDDARVARDIRVDRTGLLHVVTPDGDFELDVTVHDHGSPDVMATVEPAPDGAHRLLLHPSLVGDDERLAVVLRAAVDRWLTDRLGRNGPLLLFRTAARNAMRADVAVASAAEATATSDRAEPPTNAAKRSDAARRTGSAG